MGNIKLNVCFKEEWNGPNYDYDINGRKNKIISYFLRESNVINVDRKIYHQIASYTDLIDDDDENDEWFLNCYHKSCDFIRAQYLKCCTNKKKTIFTHIINGVDKDDVKHVLFQVQQSILASNLRRAPTLW